MTCLKLLQGRCVIVPPCAHTCFSFVLFLGVEPLHQWSILICAFRVTCCSFITSIKEKNKTAKKHHDKVANSCNVCVKDPVPTAYHSFHLKRKDYHHTDIQFVLCFFFHAFYLFPRLELAQHTRKRTQYLCESRIYFIYSLSPLLPLVKSLVD